MKHKKKLIKSAKARVTGTIPYCHGDGEGNLVSRLVFFANTPPKHDIFNYTKYYSEHWLNK
jgi:hypothetical protein